MSAAQKEKKTVSVTLTANHTHAGKAKKAGDKIDVTPRQKTWLEEQGKIALSAGNQPGKAEAV